MKTSTQTSLLIPSEFSLQNLSSNVTSVNSFLVEVDYNEDISESLRQEINDRYSRSKTNKFYKFPRISQGSSIKLKPSIYKFSLMRPSKKIIFNKRDRSFSPYSMTLNKSIKSKSPNRTEILAMSKTPLPERVSSKIKQMSRLPRIDKVKSEIKKSMRFKTLVK